MWPSRQRLSSAVMMACPSHSVSMSCKHLVQSPDCMIAGSKPEHMQREKEPCKANCSSLGRHKPLQGTHVGCTSSLQSSKSTGCAMCL